ncbi:MAG: prepilin-type N-terminal cleavage/methylation domain-containing protein [Peptococcaceae bacterium]|nr:prepilin-type N-terminal cleavage/methylation domain-containing protein [Peptococcaceae bacterium]
MSRKNDSGFTLLEIMLVVVILSMLAAVAVPRLAASSQTAREKADITSGREVKSALDRYQVENGIYPRIGELQESNGSITGSILIPGYIRKLDSQVTQQNPPVEKRGFGIADLTNGTENAESRHLIMILLTTDGSSAEVKVYDQTLTKVLWSSI